MSKREESFQEKYGSDPDGWRGELQLTPTKQPKALLTNALLALRNAEEWQGVLAHNDFSLCILMLKPPPWLKQQGNDWTPRRWTDCEDALCCDWLQREGIGVNVSVAATAAVTAAKDAAFHPVRDYLNELVWDRKERVANCATNYLGAEASDYHRNVSRSWLISSVARIMDPGCKVDTMPILEGPQDKGKSTAIRLLFEPWFTDDIADLGSKASQEQLGGMWGVEVAELAAMTRPEIERIKAFLTRRTDRFRPSYGRHVVEFPRQAVIVGTTNADLYLKDETGGRRYLPIKCGSISLEKIKRDRDQLWGEAVFLYKAGERWWLEAKQDVQQAREQQSARFVEDPWQPSIERYLQDRADTSVSDILDTHLGIDKAKWTQAEQNRVARVLRVLQWERYKTGTTPRVWRYRRCPS